MPAAASNPQASSTTSVGAAIRETIALLEASIPLIDEENMTQLAVNVGIVIGRLQVMASRAVTARAEGPAA